MNDKEASDVVEAALNSVLPMMGNYEEGDLLIEWALVAYVSNPDSEKKSGYPMLFSNGDLPDHRAAGLFATGMKYLGVFE